MVVAPLTINLGRGPHQLDGCGLSLRSTQLTAESVNHRIGLNQRWLEKGEGGSGGTPTQLEWTPLPSTAGDCDIGVGGGRGTKLCTGGPGGSNWGSWRGVIQHIFCSATHCLCRCVIKLRRGSRAECPNIQHIEMAFHWHIR